MDQNNNKKQSLSPLRGDHRGAKITPTIVHIGTISIGGPNPIRVQSMTNTNTLDTASSVEQCIRIIEAGGELVRLTAQGVREAENLREIKRELRRAGFDTPLVADIHFNPAAAETAARLVEKVRINPGNYTDKRASFKTVGMSEQEYAGELERIHERLLPLINICRENGTAVRLGINHGSLSDRIMTRYGNTPLGMVESAMEFLEVFRAENFHNLVLSMKSSDTAVMVEANRMLVKRMTEGGFYYPLHLGVTEAGEGEDGRIKSAAGIGTLLSEGIGDTIRVSLSEDPELEIPVAREIVRIACGKDGRRLKPEAPVPFKHHEGLYRPEVPFIKDGKIVMENGKPFDGTVTILNDSHNGEPAPEGALLQLKLGIDDPEQRAITAAVMAGKYFITRQASGLIISDINNKTEYRDLAFSVLQATDARITRTRYISCPTCGRTKFNLVEAVKKVKERTSHFSGLKIAVMGCIVNGPGEMAGADYGYVGAADGKVHIYRGTTAVLKNIPEEEAVERLVGLIEKDGKDGEKGRVGDGGTGRSGNPVIGNQ